MKVAIAYDIATGEIGEHFGHAVNFAIYDYYGETVAECNKTVIDCSEYHGHEAMAKLMADNEIAAVMSQNMGGEAKAQLLSLGIVPVVGYCGDADTAADMLITGTLPSAESSGSCGGGCGGCGGSCDSGCGGCCG